mmetsp:Transcript_931/g.3210  ORF Transcript_931/g.3210 Transcript_931/m.3210 type:complete len:107 (-) Transcript_931:402-722(-)
MGDHAHDVGRGLAQERHSEIPLVHKVAQGLAVGALDRVELVAAPGVGEAGGGGGEGAPPVSAPAARVGVGRTNANAMRLHEPFWDASTMAGMASLKYPSYLSKVAA